MGSGPGGVAYFILISVIFGGLLAGVPLMWRGRTGWAEEMPDYWTRHYSAKAWPRTLRSYPAIACSGFFVWISYGLLTFTTQEVLTDMFLTGTVISASIATSVWWFEWPQFLIPPRHRRTSRTHEQTTSA